MVPRLEEIRAAWRKDIRSEARWTKASNQAGAVGAKVVGEAGGFFVESEALPGRRAYLKPRKREGASKYRARAAREKIASDLAFDFGLLVPPVLLWERAADQEERAVCLSLVMYPTQWAWGVVQPILEEKRDDKATRLFEGPLAREAAYALAFDVWIGQTDHDHPSNIMFGYEPNTDGHYVFLDFAFAFGNGGRWDDGGWEHDWNVGFPNEMRRRADPASLREAVEKIEGTADGAIRQIVERVPDTHMWGEERDLVLQGLLKRRELVRVQLASYL